jgi:hypothetical protein
MAKYLGSILDGTKGIAAVIAIHQVSFSAKRQKKPPVGQPIDASRSREYLTADEIDRLITAADLYSRSLQFAYG